jgi:hypothetical protein
LKGNIKMKKILALVLASLMLLACVACGNTNDETTLPADDVVTDAPETEAPIVETPVAESALEILTNTWAAYPEAEKFMAAGGFGDTMNWEGVGSVPTDNEEALGAAMAYFVLTEEAVAMVDEIAHLMHGMNANTFTAGGFHLKDAANKDAFINSVKESVLGNRWMCGMPEKLVIITVGDFVITAFGHAGVDPEFSANTVPTFVDALMSCYEGAVVVVDEAIGA